MRWGRMQHPELPYAAHTLARTTDPGTSRAAAAACRNLRQEHADTILRVMREQGGTWTADEIAARCTLDRHQIGRRLGELERAGLVYATGDRRPTPSGRMARCYALPRRQEREE